MIMMMAGKECKAKCPRCGEVYTFELTTEEFAGLLARELGSGELIQNVLPNRTPAERELLRGGDCGKCWEEMFGMFEEEEEEEEE